jgi:predicted dehydrogenase
MIERVLIVGLGSIGKRHLRICRELLPAAEIQVLRHQECAFIPEFSNGCFTTLAEAIAFAPQLAVIASPATFHLATAESLVATGAHILVEKPIAASTDGVGELLEAARQHGAILMTGYNLRFLPSLQKFRDLLVNEAIGRVISVRCEIGQYLPSWRPDSDYRQGVSARRELGGGALLELSHEIDYLRWIFGEVDRVSAWTGYQSSLDIDVEDTAHLTLFFLPKDDGRQLVGTLNMDLVRHDTTRLCTAIGERGSLRWNGLTGVVEKFDVGAIAWIEMFKHQPHRDDSYLAEWQYLLACIQNGSEPLITGEDGLKVLRIVEAARKAALSGCRTRVESNEGAS